MCSTLSNKHQKLHNVTTVRSTQEANPIVLFWILSSQTQHIIVPSSLIGTLESKFIRVEFFLLDFHLLNICMKVLYIYFSISCVHLKILCPNVLGFTKFVNPKILLIHFNCINYYITNGSMKKTSGCYCSHVSMWLQSWSFHGYGLPSCPQHPLTLPCKMRANQTQNQTWHPRGKAPFHTQHRSIFPPCDCSIIHQ